MKKVKTTVTAVDSPAIKKDSTDDENCSETQLLFPHERDEGATSASIEEVSRNKISTHGPRQVIAQAERDIKQGLLDSERRGTPSNVPGPAKNPAHVSGTEVPAEGVNRTR